MWERGRIFIIIRVVNYRQIKSVDNRNKRYIFLATDYRFILYSLIPTCIEIIVAARLNRKSFRRALSALLISFLLSSLLFAVIKSLFKNRRTQLLNLEEETRFFQID